jgi:hypothetical protein
MVRVASASAKPNDVVPVVASRLRSPSNDTRPGLVCAQTGRPSESSVRVASVCPIPAGPRRKADFATTALRVLGALYAWALWAFMVALVGSQFLGIVWNTSERSGEAASPFPLSSGMRKIIEADESPYSDRAVACMLNKRRFSPKQLHLAISSSGVSASTIDAASRGINGFRVTPRDGSQLVLNYEARASYTTMCSLMAAIVDPILDSCESLGYNVTRDALRVVPSVDGDDLVYLPDSLPVLILPLADNNPYARMAVPGWDGSACTFSLEGISTVSSATSAIASGAAFYMIGASRAASESFLTRQVHSLTDTSSGAWRNGWYEVERSDGASSKWYGNAISTARTPDSEINVPQRQFKLQASGGKELDCSVPGQCQAITYSEAWETPSTTMDVSMSEYTSAIVANASRYGRYHSRIRSTTRITSQYDLATFISDVSVLAGLLRWGAALAALHLSYAARRQIPYRNGGIGVLSCSRSFNFVPILLLPRVRVMLAAFATLGLGGHAAMSAGDQSALLNAWFVVYPATAEFLVYFYCLLNWAGILFKRRVTDSLFGPTLITLCLLHYCRDPLASLWFDEDSTLSPSIEASEFATAGLSTLFTSDLLVRLNSGGSKKNGLALFALKLALLGVNALFMLIPTRYTSFQARSRDTGVVCTTEQTLAFRASRVGGLGISSLYEQVRSEADGLDRPMLLNSYEVARLGYIIVGGKFLIGIADWYKLLLLSPMRFVRRPTNIRIVLFMVHTNDKGQASEDKPAVVCEGPVIVRVNDPRLCSINIIDISIKNFQ